MNQTWKIVAAVIITAVIAGGGVYCWQQSENSQPKGWILYESTKGFSFKYPPNYEVNESVDPSDSKNTVIHIVAKKTGTEGVVPSLEMNISPDAITFSLWEGIPWEGFPAIVETFTAAEEENASSSADDVEWLTYSDNDISFTYPKTFLGTSLKEDSDQNLSGTEWKVTRQDNTIYIRPNFESPAAESGATYEINVLQDTWAAEEEWANVAQLHQGPESQWGEKSGVQADDYYVGVLSDLDFGLGKIADVYALVPGGIDGLGKSNKPTEKHFIIYTYSDLYSSYIKDTLIPGIKAE